MAMSAGVGAVRKKRGWGVTRSNVVSPNVNHGGVARGVRGSLGGRGAIIWRGEHVTRGIRDAVSIRPRSITSLTITTQNYAQGKRNVVQSNAVLRWACG